MRTGRGWRSNPAGPTRSEAERPMTPETSARPDLAARDRARPVVEHAGPAVDCGRYPAKRIAGDTVLVHADAFADGHDLVTAEVRWRGPSAGTWASEPMRSVGNDRWEGSFKVAHPGRYEFAVRAGLDRFATWVHDLTAKVDAGQDVTVDLLVGERLLTTASRRARGPARAELRRAAARLRALSLSAQRTSSSDQASPALPASPSPSDPPPPATGSAEAVALVHDDSLRALASRHQDAGPWVSSETLHVEVARLRAGFGSWYELFPRSASADPARPGRLTDVVARLPDIARMGFDVLYLPPIHPIGHTNRKGPDGARTAGPDDPGSPWAIGSEAGGHTAVAPSLGSLDDVGALIEKAADHGIEVALDLALQCSPDHPWVTEHPTWFRRLPDGSIACAENPPKRYEDVYPIDFETADWAELWLALLGVVTFWANRGVRIFRVDNPHTKPLRFWSWLIPEVRRQHSDVLFLAEAFTKPRVMEHLAKIGFDQSYTYFTWRNAKWELETYLAELTQTEVAEYLRPNLWPNTPDILHATLQHGGRATFMSRLVLAATLSANYGVYGPPFELLEHEPRHEGSEEYLHSEKYETRWWDLDRPGNLSDLIARINRVRRDHPALQQNRTLRFHHIDNDQLLIYSKRAPAEAGPPATDRGPSDDVVLVVVNLDPAGVQSGWTFLTLDALGVHDGEPFEVHDLLTDARYEWRGPWNYVRLDPGIVPAHVFQVRGGSR